MKNRRFYVLLHARGETLASIAVKLGARSHVPLSKVINGQRSGKETWPKLEPLLTKEELASLGRIPVVSGGTMFHVEQEISVKIENHNHERKHENKQ